LQRTVNSRLRPVGAPARVLSTVPSDFASSPRLIVPPIGVTAVHLAATVPPTRTVPEAWANAGEVMEATAAAAAKSRAVLFISDLLSTRKTGSLLMILR